MPIPIDLTPFESISVVNLFELRIPNYRIESTDSFQEKNFFFTDGTSVVERGTDDYLAIGKLVVTEFGASNIRTADDSVVISLSGVPSQDVKEIINSEIKGCFVRVTRAFFDPKTAAPLPVRTDTGGNLVDRFVGYVSNYTISEIYDTVGLIGTATVNLECSSLVSTFKRGKKGLKTNPEELRALTNNQDISFDRIPNLIGAVYEFGVPR